MSASDPITLGIGSPFSIPVLVLTGLDTGVLSPNQEQFGVILGVTSSLAGNVIYSMPPRILDVEWQSTIATLIDASVDGTTWVTLDSSTGADLRQISNWVAPFIRPSAAITILTRKKKKM